LLPPAVSGSVGELPDVMSPRYRSVPVVVVERTVNVVEPLLVDCGFEVSSVVDVPLWRVNVTE
jgi:hypothetical protein